MRITWIRIALESAMISIWRTDTHNADAVPAGIATYLNIFSHKYKCAFSQIHSATKFTVRLVWVVPMSEEIKNQIIAAWNRYLNVQQRRYRRNEGSSAQNDDAHRTFKDGIANHSRLSKKEKVELLSKIGGAPA
jgi:hypothetical protein